MTRLVRASSIEKAGRALDGVAIPTHLAPAPWLADAVTGRQPGGRGDTLPDIRLKCENLQRGGAFKLRGAYTMISRLDGAARARGVITYSSGNHAQAVAIAASMFQAPAIVVMPTTAPAIKVDGAKRAGAEIVFEGTTSIERQERAEAIAAERSLTIIPPFDHPDIIAGQGTVAREVLDNRPETRAILVPVGGGGLVSGIAAWVKRARPECRVIGVEPTGADAMRRSVEAGEPVKLDSVETIADGLAPVRPGDLTFLHASELVDAFVTVDDDAIRDAADRLHSESDLVVEYSGAAAVAALLSGAWDPEGRDTVAVLSGGNREV